MASSSLAPERLGKVRVAVVGDAGCGKSSLVRLIKEGNKVGNLGGLRDVERTVGCRAEVKLVHYPECHATPGAEASGTETASYTSRPHFVELWDVGGHDQYKNERSVYYSHVNGVILVHDLSFRSSAARLERWAREVAASATFSAPTPETCAWTSGTMTSAVAPSSTYVLHGFGGLPVPALIVANKCDLEDKGRGGGPGGGGGGARRFGSSAGRSPGDWALDASSLVGNAAWAAWVRVATALRLPAAWRGVSRHDRPTGGLLPTTTGDLEMAAAGGGGGVASTDRLPNPGAVWTDATGRELPLGGGLRCSATSGRLDTAAVESFFHELISRRYYSGGSPSVGLGGGGGVDFGGGGGMGGGGVVSRNVHYGGGDRVDAVGSAGKDETSIPIFNLGDSLM